MQIVQKYYASILQGLYSHYTRLLTVSMIIQVLKQKLCICANLQLPTSRNSLIDFIAPTPAFRETERVAEANPAEPGIMFRLKTSAAEKTRMEMKYGLITFAA